MAQPQARAGVPLDEPSHPTLRPHGSQGVPSKTGGLSLSVGSRVKARYLASTHGPTARNNRWYPGCVQAVYDDGSCDITYDDGDEEDGVQPQFIKPLDAAHDEEQERTVLGRVSSRKRSQYLPDDDSDFESVDSPISSRARAKEKTKAATIKRLNLPSEEKRGGASPDLNEASEEVISVAKESGESFRDERVPAAKISEPCKKRKAPASEKRVATRPASKRAEMAARAIAKQESEDEGIDSDSDAMTDEDSKSRPAARSNAKSRTGTLGASNWKPLEANIVKWTAEKTEALPVITQPQLMFEDIVRRADERAQLGGGALEGLQLADLAKRLGGRPIRVATMCSGTESPLLALDMICKAVQKAHGAQLNIEHVFSCEIEPFKQAYIERNFAPPLLFRDIRELHGEEATTAYGASRPVPGDVDVLIAGTSCVDYSNLNNQSKTIEARGESGQTFWGMLGWIRRHRPPIVIQENVCSAPWEVMVKSYAKEGYLATYMRVDTKQHYIPHTRTRVYLLAVDSQAPAASHMKGSLKSRAEELPRWVSSINELSCPSSSALEAFLLPTDDPRVHRAREDLSRIKRKEDRKVTDWGRCETRHQRARVEENLGAKRPMTMWESKGHCTLPDFAWHDWGKAQVERVLDLMDINMLRMVKTGVDPNYKTMVWNLSQNVDRTTGAEGRPGVSPCLTPNMVPYITNRGGPLIGPEVLSLQGIPVEDLLLTRESEDQMLDLAGNAMTSTIVGTCLLSALLLGQDYLKAHTLPDAKNIQSTNSGIPASLDIESPSGSSSCGLTTSTGVGSSKVSISKEHGSLALTEQPLQLTPLPSARMLDDILARAASSARMCPSEGREGLSPNIAQCRACGATISAGCCSWPEHVQMFPVKEDRVDPRDFEAELKAALPMCLELEGLRNAAAIRPEGSLVMDERQADAILKAAIAGTPNANSGRPSSDQNVQNTPNIAAPPASKSKVAKAANLLGWLKKESKASKMDVEPKNSTDDELWEEWSSSIKTIEGSRFYFRSVTRAETWVATYKSSNAKLLLELSRNRAEWLLFVNPPAKRGVLRTLLARPVARMQLDSAKLKLNVNAHEQLLSGSWEICFPSIKKLPVVITAVGEPVDSFQASIGLLDEWEGSLRHRRHKVSVAPEHLAYFDMDVRGEYELLDKCGGAMGSLHKRVGDGPQLFMLLDPSRTGEAKEDAFVFASSFHRVGYGEVRRTVAELDCSWRPWRKSSERLPAQQTISCKVQGLWRSADPLIKVFPAHFASASVATPVGTPRIALDVSSGVPAAVSVVRCKVPLNSAEAEAWPVGRWGSIALTKSRATFEAISWLTSRLVLPSTLGEWSTLDCDAAKKRWIEGESPCEACAPTMPVLSWRRSGAKMVAVEDPVQAGAYEQRLKHRPPAFVVERRVARTTEDCMLGELRVAVNPLALGLRALALLQPSGLATKAELRWRLMPHSDRPIDLPRLVLRSNKTDPSADQPEHFCAFAGRPKALPVLPLRPEQQRSLHWMRMQEADDAPPFIESEMQESVLPSLSWRLEASASMPRLVRGGVLADEVGYGKTVITIALIDSMPRVAPRVPAPLRASAFVPIKATLVLAPSHLLKQWPREVEKFTGGALKTVVLSTMADLNKLSIKQLRAADIVVAAITLFRNDLYFQRLANLAGSDSLPSTSSGTRYFQHAYTEAVGFLREQTVSIASGGREGLDAARARVVEGADRRRANKKMKEESAAARLGTMKARLESGPQLQGVGKVTAPMGKKATYAAEKRATKKMKASVEDSAVDDSETEEAPAKKAKGAVGRVAAKKAPGRSKLKPIESDEESEEESEYVDSDEYEEEKPRKKRSFKGARAGSHGSTEEERDPWQLFSGETAREWEKLRAPPLEMFYWNRLVVDEYTYNKERDHIAIVHGLHAHSRWVLSGTPDISGFAAVSEAAQWLGVRLGCADAQELTAREKKEQSAVERFQYFCEAHTWAWYQGRHQMAQSFLDRFVRQNIAEIDEIPWAERAVRVQLPAAERALYVELKNHLEALDMKHNAKSIKSKCKSENDRESRLAQVLGGSESPDEALLKRCAHFDIQGSASSASVACDHIVKTRRQQLAECEREIVRQTGYARDCIERFEKDHKTAKMDDKTAVLFKMPRSHFDDWSQKELLDCGDAEANQRMPQLLAKGLELAKVKIVMPDKEKSFKDKMAWVRDQVHLLRRLQKELTGRIRSLRFFEGVRNAQRRKCSLPTAQALLSCCGHVGDLSAVWKAAKEQMCFDPSCRAAVRPSCVIPLDELGYERAEALTSFGAKISSLVSLIQKIPQNERVLVFVQFGDLLAKVSEALARANVKAAQLVGTPVRRSSIIEAFQMSENNKGEPRVLLLNLHDESAAGANLTAASHAIFVHPLLVHSQVEYDSCDTQAIGRVRRYGQSRTVNIYRFLVDDSIDTDIFCSRRNDGAQLIDAACFAH